MAWLVAFLPNKKPILVIVFLVLLSILQKNYRSLPLIFQLSVSCFHSNCRRMYRRSDPFLHIIYFSYSFYENSDTFRCNKMHIYHAYCRNNLKRQSVFTRPIFHKSLNKMTSWNVIQIKSWHRSWDKLSIYWKKKLNFMTLCS